MSWLSGTPTKLVALGLVALVSACAASGAPLPESAEPVDAPPSQSPPVPSAPTPPPTASPSPEPTPTVCGDAAAAGASCQVVPAKANIFGAGHDKAPAPAEGGGGVLPPMWEVPDGARTVQVTETAGQVRPMPDQPPNGAGGRGGPTGIGSWEGISGILHDNRSMFLVGVFLSDAPPGDDAPKRLDFTGREEYGELSPEIGQTFYLGSGEGNTVIVPEGATRLYLGFADAYLFTGLPGWYGNNSGQLAVTVAFGE